MAGIIPPPRTEATTVSDSELGGALLVAPLMDLLALRIRTGQLTNSPEFPELCVSLARGIDYAVANNEVPLRAKDLPLLLKQVYKCKDNPSFQAAVMVLMMSVKNACRVGWFLNKDVDDLLFLAEEIGRNFSNMEDVNVESSCALHYISNIMSRFYPQIKIGQILSSLVIKPGYGVSVVDFHILRSMVGPMHEKIGLFVAQTDSMDTSSCLVTPPKVNFLLNGRGVEGRINVSMAFNLSQDNGPQLPTNVSAMLKYGMNLLQAVGHFNGHYVIAIAFMSVISSSGNPVLQDYVQPVVSTLDSDSNIIKGPSQISLYCPISCQRIKIPVKGHLCKHHQCFDYDNFMEINSRRPSWRCPHCNQSVCYPDIRIDQNIVKVLREAGQNTVDVIISTDGSWKEMVEKKGHTDLTCDRVQNCRLGRADLCDYPTVSNIQTEVMGHIAGGCNGSNSISVNGAGDGKILQDNVQGIAIIKKSLLLENTSTNTVDQNASAQMDNDFWSEMLSTATITTAALATGSNTERGNGIYRNSPFNIVLSPVLVDAVSPGLSEETGDLHQASPLTMPFLQNHFSDSHNSQAQRSRFASVARNVHGGLPTMPTKVSSTPMAAQGCSKLNSFSVLNSSSSPQHHPEAQDRNESDQNYFSGQSVGKVVGIPTQGPGASSSLLRPLKKHQNQTQPNPREPMKSQVTAKSHSMFLPSIHVEPAQAKQRGGNQALGTVANKPPLSKAAAPPTAQIFRQPPLVPVQLQASRAALPVEMAAERLRTVGEQRPSMTGTTQPLSRLAGGSVLAAADQNWRPSGRMRGSLVGEAYSAALSKFMPQSTQPARASELPSHLPSTSHPALQGRGLPASNPSALHNLQAPNQPTFGDATGCSGSSGALPTRSMGMH
ncbi:E4 SUMO-protein ligase PIAL2-like isoform X2 [Malania oleifera]|uniref:E4 SUMO-protein ligase PIAL2-like isoform X2 n=1 Tax=Malania oleifera TaxID=397392 RepID=UPI0025ADA878|nr:E4 SUMO-protein ligase PIAL2-like isoform X2 [Malania oleifera]